MLKVNRLSIPDYINLAYTGNLTYVDSFLRDLSASVEFPRCYHVILKRQCKS